MPFKLRLKKSRQYNVVSKSLFVICVELLDGTSIECTLSAESVGRECLDNVCQRLGLQQLDFFGLRYVNRHGAPRWVEMERPLKKQLDKYAREPNLYLRVMYYVSGVSLLHDEMTRYHYFLQLKKDVIEGRIMCNLKQASMLASYSMQAEFGNHDFERHTAEYLKDFALFPKHLTEEGHLESLTQAVILQHASLAGLAQGTAEEYYILAAQQLEGYGQETFLAKDDSGCEVIIGVCLTGIMVRYENNSSSKFYRWKDITNVINHKRYFGMECQDPADSTQYQLPDVETAKYIWRMCVHQHTFFMQNEAATESGNSTQAVHSLFSFGTEDNQIGSSHEELDATDIVQRRIEGERQRAQSTSCLDLAAHHSPHDIEKLRAMLPSYRPAPDYETAIQHKYRGHPVLYSSQPEIHQGHLQEGVRSYGNAYKHFPDVTRVERVYVEQAEDNHLPHTIPNLHAYRSTPELDGTDGGLLMQVFKPPPPYTNRPSSNSTPDLASQPLQHTQPFISTQHLDEVSNNNIVYYMGRGGALLHQANQPQITVHQNQFTTAQKGGVVEPIYENVPLPWVSDGDGPRSRAASIQSAPEMRAHDSSGPQLNLSQASTMTSSAHERLNPNMSIDSSTRSSDSSASGTLTKTGKSRGIKWFLGGGSKNKHSSTLTKPGENTRIQITSTISKESMCQVLEKKLADTQLFFEFEKIPKQKNIHDFSAALRPENTVRNRFNDILPYEDNRVRIAPTKENKSGYINASHITATVGSQQRFYIAAQSPLTSTVATFWQMVWEADVYLVVSLIAPGEEIAPYLPIAQHVLHAGHFEVMCQFSQETGHCATSKLRLYNVDTRSSRGVWHLQYTEWGHQGCPNTVPHFLGFLEELSSVRQHTVTEIPAGHNRNPPVLVHCSTGVGPTAVTILSDLLLYTLDHNQELDIARVVFLLRHQRMFMVQNISQYRFVHSLLIYYLKNSRLI